MYVFNICFILLIQWYNHKEIYINLIQTSISSWIFFTVVFLFSLLFPYLWWVNIWFLYPYLLHFIKTPQTEHSIISKAIKYLTNFSLLLFPICFNFEVWVGPETCLISSKLRGFRAVLYISPIKIHKRCIPSSASPEGSHASDHAYQMAWSL